MADPMTCGCCAGTDKETPEAIYNAPGLQTIAYRIGTQPQFRASMLARLSSTDYPALSRLTARAEGDKGMDWTVAVCDAVACAAHVVTFYQERLINESFLRTATERRSVIELARLTGYRAAPGVAASTSLAFTLEPSPGQLSLAAQPVTIPAGTRVQSIPDPGQMAQTFETVVDLPARVEWNAMPVVGSTLPLIAAGSTDLYVAGTGLQISQGDSIALVTAARYSSIPANDPSLVVWIDRVEEDKSLDITRLSWTRPLTASWDATAANGFRAHVFRQRAALFGAAAPDANLLANSGNAALFDGTKVPDFKWPKFEVPKTGPFDLDALYSKVVGGSWVASVTKASGISDAFEATLAKGLGPVSGGLIGGMTGVYIGVSWVIAMVGEHLSTTLYRISAVDQLSRSDFALSAKITRLHVDGNATADTLDPRTTLLMVQSEELIPVPRPVRYPVYGSTLVLGVSRPGLAPGQKIAVNGKRQRVTLPRDTGIVKFIGQPTRVAQAGETFPVLGAPASEISPGFWQPIPFDALGNPGLTGTLRWTVLDHDGHSMQLDAAAGTLAFTPATRDDSTLSEVVTLLGGIDAVKLTPTTTTLALASVLVNCYDRSTVAVNANIADATHGETVTEIAGSGNASLPAQSFTLKQAPLTYVSSPSSPQGATSTLEVRVNSLLWAEVPFRYSHSPKEHVYDTWQDDMGVTRINFGGDGARLPTGQSNVRLRYRKGIGSAGNLRSGQLTSLLTRPLGVKSVVNANDATGGADAEDLTSARMNAPLRILTLDRAVSLSDYADYARAFAGVAKAHAMWIGNGPGRGIHVTIAGADGKPIPDGSDTQSYLVASLRAYGDPLMPLTVHTYTKATFTLKLAIAYTADADPVATTAAVVATLRAAYAFDARAFGQPVNIDEVYAIVQSVPGVLAVDIQRLYRTEVGPVGPQPVAQLVAALPALRADGTVSPAELLTLDPAPFELGAMA
ncbi:putative phage baseplate assembly protein [Luteibacter rhizovicinus]|uniref:Putative phage baseplate assembly protein n=1 Tax=Luteibacter rhizovicinus TaxID=242606 RepID=A0A4R3YQM5_9GAMM|nr:putative baseplate assembly protein [Luteibacter rhizovicinus]TCV94666.1 putative phage baseplate assembly protein [Luteibacter rhizovicinus]